MPIFASTTTSGYSDPMKAMSIKALEARLQAQQAQMAQQQPDAAMMSTIPGGIGHVLGVVGDRMNQSRTEQAVAAQKEELARRMSGYDPAGDAPPPASIATLAPDMYKDMMQTWAENRRQRAGFTQQDKDRTEDARLAQEAKIAEEARLGKRPGSDAAKIAQDVKNGLLTPEQGEAMIAKISAPSASEMKAGNELQNTHLDTQGAIGDLKEARDLLGPDGTGIRAGTGAGATQIGAKWVGDALGMSDPDLTQRTERYNQIMSAEAITAMAAKLKGASTDYEMREFKAIMNDPNAHPKTKMQALNTMIAKAEAHQALQLEQMKRAKVSVPAGAATAPAATAGGGGADPLEGRTATGADGKQIIRRGGKWEPM